MRSVDSLKETRYQLGDRAEPALGSGHHVRHTHTRRHVYFYLYVVIDQVSRKVVAWELQGRLVGDVAHVWDQGLLARPRR